MAIKTILNSDPLDELHVLHVIVFKDIITLIFNIDCVCYFLHYQDPSQDQGAEGASGPGARLRRNPGHTHAGEVVRGGTPVRGHQRPEQLRGQRAQSAPQPPRRLPPHPSAPPAPALRLPLHPSQQSPQRPASVCRQVGGRLHLCMWSLVFGINHWNQNVLVFLFFFLLHFLKILSSSPVAIQVIFFLCCCLYVLSVSLEKWINYAPTLMNSIEVSIPPQVPFPPAARWQAAIHGSATFLPPIQKHDPVMVFSVKGLSRLLLCLTFPLVPLKAALLRRDSRLAITPGRENNHSTRRQAVNVSSPTVRHNALFSGEMWDYSGEAESERKPLEIRLSFCLPWPFYLSFFLSVVLLLISPCCHLFTLLHFPHFSAFLWSILPELPTFQTFSVHDRQLSFKNNHPGQAVCKFVFINSSQVALWNL